MILVTGAAGKTGRAVVQALVSRGAQVRALVHRPGQVQPLEEIGAHQVRVADMRAAHSLVQVADGVRAVYHICPNVHPGELLIGQNVIAVASASGVSHLVYHSVLHPQTEEMPHHWLKLRVEEQVFRSGLAYTILQPSAYMQNILVHRQSILDDGVYPVPYPVATRLSLVDLEDVAHAAATVLTTDGHAAATYELVGPEALTQSEIATMLGRLLGRPVEAQEVPLATWISQAKTSGLGAYQIDTLTKMFQYYGQNGFCGNPNVLAWLLGRQPTSLAEFVARYQWSRN